MRYAEQHWEVVIVMAAVKCNILDPHRAYLHNTTQSNPDHISESMPILLLFGFQSRVSPHSRTPLGKRAFPFERDCTSTIFCCSWRDLITIFMLLPCVMVEVSESYVAADIGSTFAKAKGRKGLFAKLANKSPR